MRDENHEKENSSRKLEDEQRVDEGIILAREIKEYIDQNPGIKPEVIICVPFTHLDPVARIIKGGKLRIGAQNCAAEESGAYTGEVSPSMIASTGTEYVIIGHSERRSLFSENDATLFRKVNIALKNDLKVIFCCGETLSEREEGRYFDVVKSQLEKGVFQLTNDEIRDVVVAYEPVWAIGTGKTASSDQAQEMHAYIRKLISNKYGEETSLNTTILYGGSCNPANAKELFSMADVDGGLIGGASLKTDDFCSIINSF
ncbi:MAG: triose-phosphate isomerase [Bacteroidales bacterium]